MYFKMKDPSDFPMAWFRKSLFLSKKHYYLIRNKDTGKANLRKLASEGKQLGAWLFSSTYGDHHNHWYNVGYEEINNKGLLDTRVSELDIEIDDLHYLHYFHTHPSEMELEIFRRLLQENEIDSESFTEVMGNMNLSGELLQEAIVQTSFPSIGELTFYYKLQQQSPDGGIAFRLISPYAEAQFKFGPFMLSPAQQRRRTFERRGMKFFELGEVVNAYRECIPEMLEAARSSPFDGQAIEDAARTFNNYMGDIGKLNVRVRG